MKILFPIDMSHSSAEIVEQVSNILPLADSSVLLMYVNEVWPAYENVLGAEAKFEDDWRKMQEDHAQKNLSEAETALQGKCQSISKEIVSGPPAMMIETVARDEHCDVTVMMPGKHALVEQLLLGSVSSNVVKHCPGTILLLRPASKSKAQLKNIIIGVDGSPNSKEAMLRAVKTFKLNERDVRILLLNVIDVPDAIRAISPVEFLTGVEQNLMLEGDTFLADAKRLLADAGVKNVDMAQKNGKAAHEIVEVAKSLPADLIILGAEGRTAVQHFLLGSVSHRIAMQAPCAVAIVKREHKPS